MDALCIQSDAHCISNGFFGLFNRYVKVLVGDMEKVTSVKTKTLNPCWDETFEMLISKTNAAVVLQVW